MIFLLLVEKEKRAAVQGDLSAYAYLGSVVGWILPCVVKTNVIVAPRIILSAILGGISASRSVRYFLLSARFSA